MARTRASEVTASAPAPDSAEPRDDQDDRGGVPGGDARTPTEIPARGWLQVVKRGFAESGADQVPLMGAGVAFFSFLALFPAVIAVVSLYGFFADPATIVDQVTSMTSALPEQARSLIVDQVSSRASGGRTAFGVGALVSILVALWSTSGGVSNLVAAINTAYDEDETRGFVKKRLLALALTIGAIVFMVIMLALVAVVPPLINGLVGDSPLRWVVLIGRWVVLVVLVSGALAVLYRVAPDRDAPKLTWVSVGAVVATVIWLAASIGFSVYVSTFGNYARTYGVFAGIIVLLMWMWLTAYAILLGAEINAEAEQQTAADTTTGPERALGQRGAVKADTTPGE